MLKTVKKFAWLVACAALVFGAVSCSDPEDPDTPVTPGEDDNPATGITEAVTYDLTATGPYKDAILAVDDGISGNSAITLSSDVKLIDDTATGVKLILRSASNSDIGSTAVTTNAPNFKYNASDVGLIIKNSAIKVTGVTGKVKVTVEWRINGKKEENNRYMCMKVGANAAIEKGNVATSSATVAKDVLQEDLVDTYDFGTTAGDIYIGASNELAVKSIKIEPAE